MELEYIFVRLITIVKILADNNIYHSDVKDLNIVLKTIMGEKMQIYLIDLGGAVLN